VSEIDDDAVVRHDSDDIARFEPPKRELRDPSALRALAHPTRLAILDQLEQLGSGTATELAERLQGESPGNCSWHLRQLARYGFIEEAGRGPGRQRRWKPIVESRSFGGSTEPPELARAADGALDVLLDHEIAGLREWRRGRHGEPREWQDVRIESHNLAWMTAEEADAFGEDLWSVVKHHFLPKLERTDPARRPPDARPMKLIMLMYPKGPSAEKSG
jgi:DNA-binding transcriptional ArsR family regulator